MPPLQVTLPLSSGGGNDGSPESTPGITDASSSLRNCEASNVNVYVPDVPGQMCDSFFTVPAHHLEPKPRLFYWYGN